MVLVEVVRKAYLASIVPVAVNAILNEHQLVIDIIAFVSRGDFPRSRLGEKQRGKILASWVTRKMQTIAQFAIRDADNAEAQIREVAEPVSGLGSSTHRDSFGTSLLRHSDTATIVNEESEDPMQQQHRHYSSLPTGISELPTQYSDFNDDKAASPSHHSPTGSQTDRFELPDTGFHGSASAYTALGDTPGYYDVGVAHSGTEPCSPMPEEHGADSAADAVQTSAELPAAMTRESRRRSDLWSLPSQQQQQQQQGGGGGLRAVNASASDEEDWPPEAIMHMNLAGNGSGSSRGQARYA